MTDRANLVAAAAISVGLSGDRLITAIAVALGESGGKPNNHGDKDNPKKGCGSYGLWQINSCPGRDGSGPPRFGSNPTALYDPITNARAMLAISSNGANWQPWTIFRNGAYRNHLQEARDAVAWAKTPAGREAIAKLPQSQAIGAAGSGASSWDIIIAGIEATGPFGSGVGVLADTADKLGNPLSGIDAIGSFFALLTEWDTWRRILFVVLGVIALVMVPVILGHDLADHIPIPLPV